MSHHYSGPDFGFPHGDARLDFTDLYIFPTPREARRSTLIMNVHPSAKLNPPGNTTAVPFADKAVYEIKVDTNGDNAADVAYRVQFSSLDGGPQTATVRRVEGSGANGTGDDGKIIIENAPISTDGEARVTKVDGYRFFAGWRSDPFFFDVEGALNNFQFTGKDEFTDKNVCSIVLEVPNADLGAKAVRVWARTVDGSNGRWVQADRGARAQQAVFLPGEDREAYLAGAPADDGRFIATFAHSLEHTGNYGSDEAQRLARTMLPDVLAYDPTLPVVYPTNGRLLTDDVVDFFIPILTNGKATSDKVGPHGDLLSEFPYVGPPHRT